jgi:3-deoxy-D-manno-octulosonic-acid transferase
LAVGIFPLDFWLFSRAAWRRIRPDLIVLTESELWPEHLHRARRKGVPALLVNARLSQKSFSRYLRFPALSARLLGHFERILASSEPDAERLRRLGAPADRIVCAGNLKFDVAAADPPDAEAREALRAELGFAAVEEKAPFVLIGSSTWPGEEEALLACRENLAAAGIDCRLLLVPRHAERGPELRTLLERRPQLRWFQRSGGGRPEGGVEVHLADTTGELARLTAAADLAFIGKSLPPNEGGQTPIEAAALGVPVLFGPAMSNFRAVAASLLAAGAARRVDDATGLATAVESLARDPDARAPMGAAGRKWHAANRGSSTRAAEAILQISKQTSTQA